MKSLLQLLTEEDRAAKELESRKEGLRRIEKSNTSQEMIEAFQNIVNDGEKRLEKAKSELQGCFAEILSRKHEERIANIENRVSCLDLEISGLKSEGK